MTRSAMMRRLTATMTFMALTACVPPPGGPPGGMSYLPPGAPVTAAEVSSGPGCIPPFIRQGTALARDLSDLPQPALCPGNQFDATGQAMASLLAGFTSAPPARFQIGEDGSRRTVTVVVYYPDAAARVSVSVLRFGSRRTPPASRVPPDEVADPSGIVPRFEAIEPVEIAPRTTLDGHEIELVSVSGTLRGSPTRFVCVTAIDQTTGTTWANICRHDETASALALANRIVAQDLPALRF
jgi:hypothetical protein